MLAVVPQPAATPDAGFKSSFMQPPADLKGPISCTPAAPLPRPCRAPAPLLPPPPLPAPLPPLESQYLALPTGIIDKTAQFVARNGPEFEQRILKNEQQNTKFSFLQPNDPFNAYYHAKVKELGGGAATAASASATSTSAQVAGQSTVKKGPSVTPVPPPKPQYIVNKPVGSAPLETDVIQLTAQFVARNGR